MDLCLLMFRYRQNEIVLKRINDFYDSVDEILIIDQSPYEEYESFKNQIKALNKVNVMKVLDLGVLEFWEVYALQNIKSDTVFYIDPEDEPSPDLLKDIRKLAEELNGYNGYYIKRYYSEKIYELQFKIFRKKEAYSYGYIHEPFRVKGKTKILDDRYYLVDRGVESPDKTFRYTFIDNMEKSINLWPFLFFLKRTKID
ncbi:MAG: hypothetical protein QXX98_01575, partial [Thermoplasmata archaeon]